MASATRRCKSATSMEPSISSGPHTVLPASVVTCTEIGTRICPTTWLQTSAAARLGVLASAQAPSSAPVPGGSRSGAGGSGERRARRRAASGRSGVAEARRAALRSCRSFQEVQNHPIELKMQEIIVPHGRCRFEAAPATASADTCVLDLRVKRWRSVKVHQSGAAARSPCEPTHSAERRKKSAMGACRKECKGVHEANSRTKVCRHHTT
mmetsp:Transcript_126926/g.406433  ORF Transcript_126926/g.406433 Transcript_126926/m.406433 type:complete len:210 (+) Transcript_126926:1232-1861(+)